jgi:hypothetical protein
MFLSNLGFFKKAATNKQYQEKYLNQLTKNQKDTTLKKILLSYLQQELQLLARNAAQNETITKQIHLASRLRHKMRKRRARRRYILQLQKLRAIETNHKRLQFLANDCSAKAQPTDNDVSHSVITELITQKRK